MQYKTVAAPIEIKAGKKDSMNQLVAAYAKIIDAEAVGGWSLDKIDEIVITKSNGCLAALQGNPETKTLVKVFIFKHE